MAKNRLFFTVFWIENLGLLLYGLIALTAPTILLESFSRNVYQFPASAAIAIGYFLALYRLFGFFNLLLGTSGLFLLWQFWRNSQDWIAGLVMILTLLAYLGPIVFDNTVGDIGFFEILEHMIFVASDPFAILSREFSINARLGDNILRAPDYFRVVGVGYDPMMQDALDVLLSKRRNDGTWSLQSRHSGETHSEMEQPGQPSRWNTLRDLRVLKHLSIFQYGNNYECQTYFDPRWIRKYRSSHREISSIADECTDHTGWT